MSTRLWLLVLLSNSLYNTAMASQKFGHEVGNGGDVIMCGGSEYEVLDYYLYERASNNRVIELGSGDELEKVETVLKRIESLDVERAHRYRNRLREIWNNEINWLSEFELIDLPDAGYIPTTACRMRQAIIQRQNRHPALKLLTIQKDLWQNLNPKARAGLILHELIYEEMLGLGQNNSKNARAFNAAVSASTFLTLTKSQYEALVQKLFVVPDSLSFKMDRFTYYVAEGSSQMIALEDLIATTESDLEWRSFGNVPQWVSIDQGKMHFDPRAEDVGIYTFDMFASLAFYSTAVPIQIMVLKGGNFPPVWMTPGVLIPDSSSATSINLASLAIDLEKDELRFAKVAGPEWVNVDSDGMLSYAVPENQQTSESCWIAVHDAHFRNLLEVRF
jgi:hypothetical protein